MNQVLDLPWLRAGKARLAGAPHLQALLAVLLVPLLFGLLSGQMSFATWVSFTIAGLAMGMMIFLMASGMTLVFGLMNVMNLAHGAFITLGAMVAWGVIIRGWPEAYYNGGLGTVMGLIGLAMMIAAVVGAGVGWLFERLIVKPVYGDPLKEILITLGGAGIVLEVLNAINVDVNQGAPLTMVKPEAVEGSWVLFAELIHGGIAVEKFRIMVALVGLGIFLLMDRVLQRSKLGLLIRAGVENPQMVEVQGYRIKRLFIGVFMAGMALAAMGGVLWGVYQGSFTTGSGSELLITVIVTIIVGGMGSVRGCFVGALLLALVFNYLAYLAPGLAELSTVLVLVTVLMWRPQGLIPVFRQ